MPIEHTYTFEGKTFTEVLSRAKAIKRHCQYFCCAGNWNDVKACHLTECPLHPFRLGSDPGIKKRVMTDEQKKVAVDRLKKLREMKNAAQGRG